MKKIHCLKTILCGLALLSTGSLRADIINYDYFGTVTNVHGPADPSFGGLVVGGSVTGSFSYDSTAPNLGNPASAQYAMNNMTMNLGALTYSPASPSIAIDLANAYYWSAGGQSADQKFSLSITMYDSTVPYIQADTLLRPPPDLSTVDAHYGFIGFNHGGEALNTYLYFNLDRVVPHTPSVPDSGSTLVLLGLSFGLLGFYRRRLHGSLIVSPAT